MSATLKLFKKAQARQVDAATIPATKPVIPETPDPSARLHEPRLREHLRSAEKDENASEETNNNASPRPVALALARPEKLNNHERSEVQREYSATEAQGYQKDRQILQGDSIKMDRFVRSSN